MSKGSDEGMSIATFADCAAYSLQLVMDQNAVHTCSGSRYIERTPGR